VRAALSGAAAVDHPPHARAAAAALTRLG
jgi:hypothetical protein